MGNSEEQKLHLTELLFKLQVDPEYLRRFMKDEEERGAILSEWNLSEDVRIALLNLDHAGLRPHLNPGTLPVLGWIKSPIDP
jgi:hypothetical protein